VSSGPPARKLTAAAVFGAMGVVYGDIGTSPLYALEQSLNAAGGVAAGSAALLLGVLSLMFWSLLIVVTLKYVVLIMRADNEGEGGILSLFTLVQRVLGTRDRHTSTIITLAVLGAALFYCDALITPAISVLSAVEGLELLSPESHRVIIPVTLIVIVVLFSVQSRGTEHIGRLFGPVMLVWFLTLGVSGFIAIIHRPQVLAALNPAYGLLLLTGHPGLAAAILGAVFLTLTGGEALYADMGHFGKRAVRVAWFALVWPALLLSYFGQGALILSQPSAAHLPLYASVGPTLLPFMVLLATAATVIASQATISGAFSITRQAVQLDLLPRLRILQTSAREHGQIYVPIVNRAIFVAVCLFVIGFGSSSALGAAYGAAVAGTMLITTLLGMILADRQWGWPRWLTLSAFGLLLFIDLAFLASNLMKFADGAWVPLALALCLSFVFMTWRYGRRLLRTALRRVAVPLEELPALLQAAVRVPGTAVFLASEPHYVPTALMRNLEHNHVAHERIVLMKVEIERAPRMDAADRVRISTVAAGVYLVRGRFGFMETPDVGEALRQCNGRGLNLVARDCAFFLGWHLVKTRPRRGYNGMRLRMFAWLQRRSTQAADYFQMPDKRVVILATQIEL
jgi:KUP system potassium uptake protein